MVTSKVDKLAADYEHLPICANAKIWNLARELEKQNAHMLDALKAIEEGMMHDFHYVCQEGLVKNCLCYKCQKTRIKAAIAAAKGE